MSVQRCVYLLALICRAGRSWSAAAPSPCSATSLWKPAVLHESRSSGFRNQRSRRGKTPRFLRTAKAASWRLWPTTAWRASTATAATWAWTACPPAASGWGSSRPLRRIRDTISVEPRSGRRIHTAGGTAPALKPSQWPHTCTCTHEVSYDLYRNNLCDGRLERLWCQGLPNLKYKGV